MSSKDQLERVSVECGYQILSQISIKEATKLLTSSLTLFDKYADYIESVKELAALFLSEEIERDHPLFGLYADYKVVKDLYMLKYVENFVQTTDSKIVATMILNNSCHVLKQKGTKYAINKYLKKIKIDIFSQTSL